MIEAWGIPVLSEGARLRLWRRQQNPCRAQTEAQTRDRFQRRTGCGRAGTEVDSGEGIAAEAAPPDPIQRLCAEAKSVGGWVDALPVREIENLLELLEIRAETTTRLGSSMPCGESCRHPHSLSTISGSKRMA